MLPFGLWHCGTQKPISGVRLPDDGKKSKHSDFDQQKVCNEIKAITITKPFLSLVELPQRFLDAHNQIRLLHDLSELVWDDELAAYAQRWAQHLKDKNKCKMTHRSHAKITENKEYGENLAFNWISRAVPSGNYDYSPEDVVKAWSVECEDYNYQKNSCVHGKKCGHYTQVVWHNARRVGCGMATCDAVENDYGLGRAEVWVCNYDPPGNYVGQRPY